MAGQSQRDNEAIRYRINLPIPAGRAFDVFTKEFDSWWPAEYTWSQDVLETIAIEPMEQGRCFERGPNNFECDWGRVLAWEPPRRLIFSWQISPDRVPVPDPAKASEVDVRFESEGRSETCVKFEHRHIDRHGEGAADYRSMLASPQGWPYILDCYIQAASDNSSD